MSNFHNPFFVQSFVDLMIDTNVPTEQTALFLVDLRQIKFSIYPDKCEKESKLSFSLALVPVFQHVPSA